MLTTCPECRTVFRVGQEQLDDKRGLVRCGTCSAVFNAYDTLLPELAAPPEEVATEAPRASPAGPSGDALLAMPEALAPAATGADLDLAMPPALRQTDTAAEAPDDGVAPAPDEQVEPPPEWPAEAPALPAADQDPEQDPAQEPAPGTPTPPTDDILFTPLSDSLSKPSPAAARVAWLVRLAWGMLALLLTGLLLLQLTYFLRGDLAAAVPSLRAPLENACRRLGCALPMAHDLTSLRVEASSLESDPEDKTRATLRVSLSNRGGRSVAWPHLVLVLTDSADLPIAQRPFAPGEYLPQGTPARDGFGPGQEREVRLELALKGLSAYGYRLEMAYP